MKIIMFNRRRRLAPPLPFRFCTVCDDFPQPNSRWKQGIIYHQILLVTDGVGTLDCMGEHHEIRRGCAFFTARGVSVDYKNRGGLVTAFLTVEGDGADAMVESYGRKFIFFEDLNTEKYLKNIRALQDGYYSGRAEGILSALAYSFYADFFEEGQEKRSRMDEVLLYIERHFNQPITLEALADVYRSSVSKLSHDFKEKFGVPPLRYVVDYRLDYAKLLLENEPQLTSKAVALASGFSDASYFARAYRARFGECAKRHEK